MKMKILGITLLMTGLLTAYATPAGPGAQRASTATSDGSEGIGAQQQSSAPAAQGSDVRYMVPHLRSAVFATGGGGRITSVITATNGGAQACNVTFEHYFAFNSDQVPECTISVALSAFLAPGADTANVCSRSIPGDRWTLCTASCNPELNFVQGKTLIRVPESCAAGVTFDARLYHSDAADDVRTITGMPVIRLRD